MDVLAEMYRLVVALWNAWAVLRHIVRSMIQEAKQEAAELMALLDDDGPTSGTVASTRLQENTGAAENLWQMLIIARASSFVLLVRLSKDRVLHLEVDERLIAGKLEVIKTELTLHIEHVPRMLQMPIEMHDTRVARYTPMKLPYLWKETAETAVEGKVVPVAPAPSLRVGGEEHRKKYVQLLTESALRRRLRLRMEGGGKGGVKKRALGSVPNGTEEGVPAAKVRMERQTMSENSRAENSRAGKESSVRRKRGFDLYAQSVSSEFSFLSK